MVCEYCKTGDSPLNGVHLVCDLDYSQKPKFKIKNWIKLKDYKFTIQGNEIFFQNVFETDDISLSCNLVSDDNSEIALIDVYPKDRGMIIKFFPSVDSLIQYPITTELPFSKMVFEKPENFISFIKWNIENDNVVLDIVKSHFMKDIW